MSNLTSEVPQWPDGESSLAVVVYTGGQAAGVIVSAPLMV